MKKIYLVEGAEYYEGTSNIYNAWCDGYYKDLKDANKQLLELWSKEQEKNIVYITHEITSSQNYNTINDFVEDFESYGNDEEHFFMEQLEEVNNENLPR